MDSTIDDSYRYYVCHEEFLDLLKCRRVDGPNVIPGDMLVNNTKLLFVKKYIPKKMDKWILPFKWTPSRIIIEPAQAKGEGTNKN